MKYIEQLKSGLEQLIECKKDLEQSLTQCDAAIESQKEKLQEAIITRGAWERGPWPEDGELLTLQEFTNGDFYTDCGDYKIWFANKNKEICTNIHVEYARPWMDFGPYEKVLEHFPMIYLVDTPENK